jgi:LuxR family maltose regulon positive regulatory protein
MPEILLGTKLSVPPLRALLVPRPHLIERLDQGLQLGHKVTLISAPAGFGKTTLVCEWLGTLRGHLAGESQINNRSAWLSLDDDDNDPVRFLNYFVAALNRIKDIETALGQDALSMLRLPQLPPANSILISLINDLVAVPDKIVLVLDDFHLIEAEPIQQALIFLLENLPSQLHLVIATREDPHLHLARLRVRDEVTEIRAADLRFSSPEAADFLNRVMGLNLSSADIAELESRTEGWIAGLQLAAISMQGREDRADFIKSFTGSNRLVLDYLVEDVLSQQPQNVQDFLMRTAILNLLTGSLCDALTGQHDGQMLLEMLERQNLFIVPLDEERHWYRYHHLFADLLRERLSIREPALINASHSKAMAWYETHGNLTEAIHHAVVGDDPTAAARLIEKGARAALEQSNLRFILHGVERLPDIDLKDHPWLFVYHSWALLLTGQVERVAPRLEDTEWLRARNSADDETQVQAMLGNIAAMRAVLALWQADFKTGLDCATQALAKLPKDQWIRGYCSIVVGSSHLGNGSLEAARDAYAESCSVGRASGNMMLAVSSGCNVAYVLEQEGHYHQAYEVYQDLFRLIEQEGRSLPVEGYVHIDFARVLYEMNRLGEAIGHLREGIELCRRLADGRAVQIGYSLLARAQVATGQYGEARESIRSADTADPSPGTTFDLRGGEYPQIRLWLKQKKLGELESWINASGTGIDSVPIFKTKMKHTMHARVLLTLGREQADGARLDDALELLEKLLALAETSQWRSKVIEILLLKALCFQASGDMDQAVVMLKNSLMLAESESPIRVFVDEGLPMAHLLYEVGGRGIAPEYVQRLLAAFPVAEPEEVAATNGRVDQSGLPEPLSEREIDVLQLIGKGLSNQVVATRLCLSVHTVKTHTRNIYSKLRVNNRTQAVDKARMLGILPLS